MSKKMSNFPGNPKFACDWPAGSNLIDNHEPKLNPGVSGGQTSARLTVPESQFSPSGTLNHIFVAWRHLSKANGVQIHLLSKLISFCWVAPKKTFYNEFVKQILNTDWKFELFSVYLDIDWKNPTNAAFAGVAVSPAGQMSTVSSLQPPTCCMLIPLGNARETPMKTITQSQCSVACLGGGPYPIITRSTTRHWKIPTM